MILKLQDIGEDYWGRKTYINPDTKRLYKLLEYDDGRKYAMIGKKVLFSATKDGEPSSPIRKDIKIKIMR